MIELTLIQAIKKCEEFNKRPGEIWFFKANKGLIKLVCHKKD